MLDEKRQKKSYLKKHDTSSFNIYTYLFTNCDQFRNGSNSFRNCYDYEFVYWFVHTASWLGALCRLQCCRFKNSASSQTLVAIIFGDDCCAFDYHIFPRIDTLVTETVRFNIIRVQQIIFNRFFTTKKCFKLQ